ncbi:AfsR/SARP family transcriptional regulator [Solwaraspora sp. WMMB335]|uniref:AfsR/SARP family transcriptional regulator n=1 Tax=Solwaraspora sp. WMMB335 TaxID=3404118 RepID=UPI003B926AD2
MFFRVLGPIEVSDTATHRGMAPRSGAQRVLLAALLARPSAAVATRSLIEELWGGAPPRCPANALQAHVSRLRRLLQSAGPTPGHGPDLRPEGEGYALRVALLDTDWGLFTRDVNRAAALLPDDPVTARAVLRRALGLWRGPALGGAGTGPLVTAFAEVMWTRRREAAAMLRDASYQGPVGATAGPAGDLVRLARQLDGVVAEQRRLSGAVQRLTDLVLTRVPGGGGRD